MLANILVFLIASVHKQYCKCFLGFFFGGGSSLTETRSDINVSIIVSHVSSFHWTEILNYRTYQWIQMFKGCFCHLSGLLWSYQRWCGQCLRTWCCIWWRIQSSDTRTLSPEESRHHPSWGPKYGENVFKFALMFLMVDSLVVYMLQCLQLSQVFQLRLLMLLPDVCRTIPGKTMASLWSTDYCQTWASSWMKSSRYTLILTSII